MSTPTLRELVAKATPGPYFTAHDIKNGGEDYRAHIASGLATVETGREGDWPIGRFMEWPSANLIARLTPETVLAVYEALTEARSEAESFLAIADAFSDESERVRYQAKCDKFTAAINALDGKPTK